MTDSETTDENSDAAPEPPPVPAPPRTNPDDGVRRIWRSRADRRLGGVAGGVANYFGMDPTIVRIIFVILGFTGIAILVYVAAWIIIPAHPSDTGEVVWSRTDVNQQNVATLAGIGALCLTVVIITESWTLFALALVAGGVWLLTQQDSALATSPAMPTPTDSQAQWQATSRFEPTEPNDAPRSSGSVPPLPPPPTWGEQSQWQQDQHREPRPPQRITRFVLSLLALLIALSIAAAGGGWWDVNATQMVGTGVIIVGAGVVVGTFTDLGARWLIPLGVVGLIALLPVTVIDEVVDDGIGEPTYRPLSLADLESEYRHGAGVLTLDLREVDLAGQTRAVDVDLGVGEVLVIVPPEMGGSVELHAGAGELQVAGPSGFTVRDGIDVDLDGIALPGDEGVLTLTIDVGIGAAYLEID